MTPCHYFGSRKFIRWTHNLALPSPSLAKLEVGSVVSSGLSVASDLIQKMVYSGCAEGYTWSQYAFCHIGKAQFHRVLDK
jgi:hypothetical protein